jgi:hypothetical protein
MSRFAHAAYTAEAIIGLIVYDLVSIVGFAQARVLIRACPTLNCQTAPATTSRICRAVAEACVWYVKRVRCLQQSAVTTWLLRLHGVPAELVVGCRAVPVQSHAWVEVRGEVVNDRPQYQKFFRVLERM